MIKDSRYNLAQLFQKAFGINSPIFITEPLSKKEVQNLDFKGIEMLPDYYKKEATSWMGTPIIGQLTFMGGTYNIFNAFGEIVPIKMESYKLPPATLFSFRRAKNITKTNLLGSNGTVKELFGFDDWIIDCKGIAVDTPDVSAFTQIENLLKWERLASSIQISGSLFTSKEINAITIEDYKQDAVQGSPSIIPFAMTLNSDEAIELIL